MGSHLETDVGMYFQKKRTQLTVLLTFVHQKQALTLGPVLYDTDLGLRTYTKCNVNVTPIS